MGYRPNSLIIIVVFSIKFIIFHYYCKLQTLEERLDFLILSTIFSNTFLDAKFQKIIDKSFGVSHESNVLFVFYTICFKRSVIVHVNFSKSWPKSCIIFHLLITTCFILYQLVYLTQCLSFLIY